MTPPLPDRIAAAIDECAYLCESWGRKGAGAGGSGQLVKRQDAFTAIDRLRTAIAEVVAERDALRSERDAALLVLPACCGSLADAADTLRQERDAATKRADGLAAQLAAANAQRDELIRAKTGNDPDGYFCCNGMECGCHGVTVREYELYCVDRAIARAQSGQPAQRDDDGTASGGNQA